MTSPRRRVSTWRQVARRYPLPFAAGRYVQIVERRARAADLVDVAATAREDLTRLAAALCGVIDMHGPDARSRCAECSRGEFLVAWPCPTRRAVTTGLRDGWPGVTDAHG